MSSTVDLEQGTDTVQTKQKTLQEPSNSVSELVINLSYNILGICLTLNGIANINGLKVSDIICMVSFAYYILFSFLYMLQNIIRGLILNFIFQGQYYINMPLMVSLWMNGKIGDNFYLQCTMIHAAFPCVLFMVLFLYEIMK